MNKINPHTIFTLKNIEFFLFSFLMVSFYLKNNLNGFIIFLLAIVTLLKFITKQHVFRGYSGLVLFPILFLVLIIGQIHTQDIKEGWTLVERNLSLFIVPIIASSVQQFNTTQQRLLANFFIFSGVIIGLYCIGFATVNALDTGTVYTTKHANHFIYNNFMHHRLTAPVGLHAIYYSLYIGFANIILLYRLFYEKLSFKKRLFYSLVFIFICLLLFLLKSALFAFAFSLMCLLLIIIKYGHLFFISKKTGLLILFAVLVLSFFMFKGVQSKLESFSLTYNLSDDHLTPLTMRLSLWECAWAGIKDNWLWGVGTGDAQHELLAKYKAMNFKIGYDNDFNAHNMYLNYWLSNGLLALLAFIGMFFISIKRALKQKNFIYFSMAFLFAFFSITESTMRTQKGLVFFVVFASLFYWVPNLWQKKGEE